MSDIVLIITCFADIISQIFLGLSTVKIEGISILQIFCAIIFLKMIVWFIRRLIEMPYEDKQKEE